MMTRAEILTCLTYTEGWLWAVGYEPAADYLQDHADEVADALVESEMSCD